MKKTVGNMIAFATIATVIFAIYAYFNPISKNTTITD